MMMKKKLISLCCIFSTVSSKTNLRSSTHEKFFQLADSNLKMAYKVLIGCNGWSLTKECWNPFFVGSDSSPAISDAHDEVIVGSYDNFIYNLNLQTGELNWKAKGSGGEDSPKLSPSDGSFIYAWGNLQGATLDKINRSDGRLIWSAKSPSGNADITTAGAVDDSLSLVFAGTSSGKFYAVNTFDGSIAWTYDMGCKGEMWGTLGPLSISDSTVCVGAGGNAIPYLNMDAKLVCLDKASGNLVWEAPAGKQIQSRPSLGSELIFVGDYSGHLFGYETSTGKLAFDSKLGDGILEGEPP